MTPATVLLVEDDDATAYWVQRVLRREAAEEGTPPHVLHAGSLAAAVRELARGTVHCVLLDLTLPDSTGIESFLAIRRAAPRVPVVVLTARADEALGEEAVRRGAQDFLDKSAPPEQIARAVRYALLRAEWQGAVAEAARLEAVEKELREAQRFTAALLANLPGMVYRCVNEPRWPMTFVSDGAMALTGYAPEHFLTDRSLSYRDIIHPDDRERVWREVQSALDAGRAFELRYRIVAADGTEKWVWEQGRAISEGPGEPTMIEGFITDTTRQQALEEQLRQAQKMDAVGRLAGGIAHDFNNLLTAIKGTAALMLLDLPAGSALRQDAEAIGEAVDRAARLARQLLAFGRGHVVRRDTLDLNRVVDDTARLLRRLIPAGIELSTVLAEGLAPVTADGGQIEQVLMNLVLNARDAMPPEGGHVIVETMNVEVDEASRGWAAGVAPGAYAMLVVHDTGTGIDADTLERIFEPFFTTKEVGKGTGLGLSVVYGIVQQSRGWIRVFSRPGAGTTFRILLPRAGGPPPAPAAASSRAAGPLTGTVLVVDDEPAVRRTTRRLLERAGFAVLDAVDGEDALRISRAHPGPIDLLVTDVVMPRMAGPELARHLVRERPGTPVLFVSGYSEDNAFPGASADGHFLHKPFTADALTEAVTRLLRSSGPPHP